MKHLFENMLLISFFVLFCSVSAQNTPEGIIKRYCTMRFQGAIGGTTNIEEYKKNLEEYEKLVVWDYEPGWDRLFLVDTFSIVSSRINGYKTYVDVSFKTFGEYSVAQWTPRDTTEVIHYVLVNTVEGWKVERPCEIPRESLKIFIEHSEKYLKDHKEPPQITNAADERVREEYRRWHDLRIKSLAELKELLAKHQQEKQ